MNETTQPTLIRRDALRIVGLTGDGNNTGKVWADFEAQCKAGKSSAKSVCDQMGYEVRFYNSEKNATPGRDVHVGFNALEECAVMEGFNVLMLPASEYASFDVRVADGYDSQNAAMDKWLADHAAEYGARLMDGVGYVVECYNEKFKDGVVEIWVPIFRK